MSMLTRKLNTAVACSVGSNIAGSPGVAGKQEAKSRANSTTPSQGK
jgi:hypothetical protein